MCAAECANFPLVSCHNSLNTFWYVLTWNVETMCESSTFFRLYLIHTSGIPFGVHISVVRQSSWVMESMKMYKATEPKEIGRTNHHKNMKYETETLKHLSWELIFHLQRFMFSDRVKAALLRYSLLFTECHYFHGWNDFHMKYWIFRLSTTKYLLRKRVEVHEISQRQQKWMLQN